jgi:hypothetical protein
MAAVPIKVRTIRRERFMVGRSSGWLVLIFGWDDRLGYSGTRAVARQVELEVKAADFTASCGANDRLVSTAGKMHRQRARKRTETAAADAAGAGIGSA